MEVTVARNGRGSMGKSGGMALAAALALLGSALSACGGRQPCTGPVHEIDRGPPAASASASDAPH